MGRNAPFVFYMDFYFSISFSKMQLFFVLFFTLKKALPGRYLPVPHKSSGDCPAAVMFPMARTTAGLSS